MLHIFLTEFLLFHPLYCTANIVYMNVRVNVKWFSVKVENATQECRHLCLLRRLCRWPPSTILHNSCILLKENAKPTTRTNHVPASVMPPQSPAEQLGRVLVKWQL